VVYDPKAFIPHAASRRQTFVHCEQFPVAATRRCMARVSVPLWRISLSAPLPVIALVGHYPTNKLIGRRLIPKQIVTFFTQGKALRPCGITPSFKGLFPHFRVDSYALLTRLPLSLVPRCHSPLAQV